ncbi:MAG: translation elongation factor Ts [Firmicutes bacterium]|nr:translation elongation factor Ts [Bacillota bacterium]
MAITAQSVKELREMTGCGMMDCKKALSETNGDMDKAVEYLRENGLAKAAKKAGRIAAEGLVTTYTEGNVSVVVEVNAETDFVAKNEQFTDFVNTVAKAVAEHNPADVEELKTVSVDGTTIGDMLTEKIATIGENMNIRRFARFEGDCVTYVHGEGKIGVIVKFDTDVASKPGFEEMGKDVCMQITAMNAPYLNRESVPADVVEHEKEILTVQAMNEGKPEEIAKKMVMGRINKFYKENCLLEQEFVKNGDMNIKQYIESVAKELGGKIELSEYVRMEKGEGIEKKEDDFAAEVASMIK